MRPNVYENKEEGIKCVYTNEKWLVSIKNWKPDNDIERTETPGDSSYDR